ncbi:MAG: zinc ribbon domain-containing protein [bacterium]|nr:zinc ribbon domain-containing protein [bacterium]
MPTYGYRCSDCGHEFEVFQKITAEPLEKCEACSGPVQRMFFPVGLVFKGSGFYVTDNRKSGGAKGSSEAACPAGGSSPACDGCCKAKSESQ